MEPGEVRAGGKRVYLRLIHVVVWQTPTQYCKGIILQLKTNLKKNQFCNFRRVLTSFLWNLNNIVASQRQKRLSFFVFIVL